MRVTVSRRRPGDRSVRNGLSAQALSGWRRFSTLRTWRLDIYTHGRRDQPTVSGPLRLGADLAAEVISFPDNPDRDRRWRSVADYAEAGIPEYWVVDPRDETIRVLTLQGAAYVEHGVYVRGSTAATPLLEGRCLGDFDRSEAVLANVTGSALALPARPFLPVPPVPAVAATPPPRESRSSMPTSTRRDYSRTDPDEIVRLTLESDGCRAARSSTCTTAGRWNDDAVTACLGWYRRPRSCWGCVFCNQ